jgi:hypothetical protein
MREWNPIATAPFHCNLKVAVIEGAETHAAVFPCRRAPSAEWINVLDGKPVSIHPTHWREWSLSGAVSGAHLKPAR